MTGEGSQNGALKDWSTYHLDKLLDIKYMRSLWMANVSGGPFDYTGKSLDDAHAPFRIMLEAFDEVSAEYRRALEYYNVPEQENEEAMAALIAHGDEVTAGSKIVTAEKRWFVAVQRESSRCFVN